MGDHGVTCGGFNTGPRLSVVITTRDRPDDARRAVQSVVDAVGAAVIDVVVLDDGSRSDIALELDELAGGSVRVLHQPNSGVGAARRSGAEAATGEWIAFLDDDDRFLPGWASLLDLMEGQTGIVSGGIKWTGQLAMDDSTSVPARLGPAFGGLVANYLAGSFAVRRDLYDAAGGYLPGLSCSHQTELFIRLAAVGAEMGIEDAHVVLPIVAIERRRADDRDQAAPVMLFDGGRWLMARHPGPFAADARFRADTHAIVAVNAARMGRLDDARRSAWGCVRAQPLELRAWLRLLAMAIGPIARRAWGRAAAFSEPSGPSAAPLRNVADLFGSEPTPRVRRDLLFVPWRYVENPPRSADADAPFWSGTAHDSDDRAQLPVYRLVGRLARRLDRPVVVDVGCGTGAKLVRCVAPYADVIGLDQGSGLALARRHHPGHTWLEVDLSAEQDLSSRGGMPVGGADLVVCADVIEHVEDPYRLLRLLYSVVAAEGTVILSAPDRTRLERGDPLGPPHNPRHIREWGADEFHLLVEAAGFRVRRRHHVLPRGYTPNRTEVNRTIYRILHRCAVPDRRSGLVLELRRADGLLGTSEMAV